jgi:hypothetical protein
MDPVLHHRPAADAGLEKNIARSQSAGADMVFSVHIPKTAGVSFRKILAQLYAEDFLLKYWQMTDAYGRVVTTIPANIRCIHGHYDPELLLPEYPGARLITWVRDPVERVVSSYFHRLREPDWQHPVTRELHAKKLSLLEFAGLELMRNEMARYIGRRSLEDFAFIGQVEAFESSLARFFREFGFPRIAVPRENCNPERQTTRYSIDGEIRKKIAALNAQDFEIYRVVSQLATKQEAA